VVGDREAVARIGAVNAKQREAVFGQIELLGLRLAHNVSETWLSGRALHRRSGRLASSTETPVVTRTAHSVTSSVGTNVPYGVAFELQFVGDVVVRAHTRRTSVVFGRHLDHEILQTVGPYTRHVDMSGHQFLKPALDELRPTITRTIQAALRQAADG
jgi:hypothetical protein